MIRIVTLFKGLIRRLKEHMAAVVVGIGIFSATSGLYVILEHPQYKIWGVIVGILGVILVLIGYILSYVKDREERKERLNDRAQEQAKWIAQRMEADRLSEAIIKGQEAMLTELKRLNRNKEKKE
jgi:hypothetical protein